MRIPAVITACAALLFIISPTHAEPGIPYAMTRDQLGKVQYALYELNRNPGSWDGIMRAQTRTAIREWQSDIGEEPTGYLTKDQHRLLLDSRSYPKYWGSVSASTDGAFGSTWRYSSRFASEKDALARCQNKSSRPEKCATVSGVVLRASMDASQVWLGAEWCEVATARIINVARSVSLVRLRKSILAMREGSCTSITTIEVAGRHE